MDAWLLIAVTILPLAGMLLVVPLVNEGLRPLRHRIVFNRKDKCVMCRNLFDKPMLERWSIRGERIPVCTNCHPYFKERFLVKNRPAGT